MLNLYKKVEWRFKVIIGISIFLLICLGANILIKNYFIDNINKNWNSLSSEKELQIQNNCKNLFDNDKQQLTDFTAHLSNNKKFLSSVESMNSKKTYEAFFEVPNNEDYNIEVYNSRLELFIFSGRQLYPDILELQRANRGEKFTVIKETGFYTFLLMYEPLKNVSEELSNNLDMQNGVLVVGKILDVNYRFNESFEKDFGLTKEIEKKYDVKAQLVLKPFNLYKFENSDDSVNNFQVLDFKGNNNEVIGKLLIPHLDKSSYIDEVKNNFQKFSSIILFVLNVLLLIIVLYFINRINLILIQGLIITVFLLLSRYFWLIIDFPSNIFKDSLSEVFSPVHYASSFAFGISRSLGELFITAFITLIICSVILFYSVRTAKKEIIFRNILFQLLSVVVISVVFILAIHFYSIIVQSLVYDSNLKYFDRSQIISVDHPELIIGQFIILLFSVSLVLLLTSSFVHILKYLSLIFKKYKFFNRNKFLYTVIGVIFLNIIMISLFYIYLDYTISFWLRNLIIILTALFGYQIYRQLYLQKTYKINSALNYSIIALICIIFVPAVLLAKITSQENKYLELIARKVSEKEENKITSLILTTLDDMDEPNVLESKMVDKTRASRLAFELWSESTLFSEDLNTGLYVLDKDRKVVSDFNINPEELNSDSVTINVNRTLDSITQEQIKIKNLKNSKVATSARGENTDVDENEESDITDNDLIFQNHDAKFFYGIKPLEKTNVENEKKSVTGYIVVAAQYDSKNFITQSGIQLLRNFNRDNLINKLTSTPEISEFANDELVSSTNKDLSRAFVKSLEPFRESVTDKADKSALRYDVFENQLYKSFYLLTGNENTRDYGEKIYIVSLRANDFSMMAFFFFKFLLFVVLLFIVFLFFFLIYKILNYLLLSKTYRKFKFGFREKIFVSFIVVSVIPIIALALYSREFVKEKNNEFYSSQMISDLKLVEQYIKHRSPPIDFSKIRRVKGTETSNLQDIFGRGFSESHKNFNLYVFNRLLSTTNEELYKSGLLDDRISGSAYYNIALQKKDYYSENETIGALNVIAGYKPIYDNYNNLIGIISSQTVFKQNEINQELTENLVYIFGVYFVAVIFLIIIVNILSYTISNPIIRLQRATDQLSKGNIEIEVKSNSKDEIGDLIASFNKMTKELKRSREELKKAEREGAWRDIARQVAHEIKNPLTPMKLAMQHLFYAYSKGSNDFKSILQTTNRLIIDQIETLNKIATEFSDFAKMPSRNYESLNIELLLQDVVKLLNTDNKIDLISAKNPAPVNVYGDKDEVKRALMNIIRNSLQAIDENVCSRKNGRIVISSNKFDSEYSIKIKDNGVGMDEVALQQLFEPYFSTKSSGMGLGLVITKKIIDDMNGKIFVKSELNKGTEVEIQFKLIKN